MNDCKYCQSLFLEDFYEELNTQQKQFLKDHLKICDKCKSEFEEMESTLQFMSKRVRPEPEKKFWDSYEKNLAQRIDKEESVQVEHEPWWKKLSQPLTLAPRWTYQTAAALVLIVVGVFIGRMLFLPSTPEIQQVSQQLTGEELVLRTQNYIDRSKLILLAMVNFDPATEDPYALNLPYQQQVSRELVQEASLLRRDLSGSKQRRLENLIANLEMILLQIANLESENDLEAIELIKGGADSQGILMEINLTDLRRSFKKINESRPFKQPSNKPLTF
jgi:hypothetical protein